MPKGISKDDPDYEEKRAKNNEAIRKSREKKKKEKEDVQEQVNKLKEENGQIEGQILSMQGQIDVLKEVIKQHAAKKGPNQEGATSSIQQPVQQQQPSPVQQQQQEQYVTIDVSNIAPNQLFNLQDVANQQFPEDFLEED